MTVNKENICDSNSPWPYPLAASNVISIRKGRSANYIPASDTAPPSCEVAERGVLACVLTEGNCGGGSESEMLGKLRHLDFHDLRNRGIY